MNIAKKLGLTRVKKYWRHTSQVEIELDWVHNWIPGLARFVRNLQRVYDNEKLT